MRLVLHPPAPPPPPPLPNGFTPNRLLDIWFRGDWIGLKLGVLRVTESYAGEN